MSAYHSSSSSAVTQHQLTTEALATLVEEFDAFMEKRPAYMISAQGPSLTEFTTKIGGLLRKKDPPLLEAMENFRIGQKDDVKRNVDRIEVVLSYLLHPVIRSMFVGYLPLDTVLHAWDLIILGFDRPSYDPVPYICASLLILLHKDLVKCTSEKEAETVILKGCRNIEQNRLRLAIAEFGFEKELRKMLDIADEGQFPVFHPTIKSNLPPWKHWYSSKIIAQLQDERAYTEPKVHGYQSPVASSHVANGHDEPDPMWDLEQARLELEEECQRLREERDMLATHVEEERRLRVEMQEHADEEIDRLRRQLHALENSGRRKVLPSPKFSDSDQSLVRAPPPTVASSTSKVPSPVPSIPKARTPVEPVHKEPEHTETPVPKAAEPVPEVTTQPDGADEQQAKQVTSDVVKKMMEGIFSLAHGTGKTKNELDRLTRKDYEKFMTALNKAQASVFGQPFSNEVIERLTTPERNEKMERVRQETVKQLFK